MKLTDTQRRVLTQLRDADDANQHDDSEIVCDGIECWLGHSRVSYRTVTALLNMVLLHYDDLGGTAHYTINGSGRAALQDESVIERIQTSLATNQPCDERGNAI